MASSRDEIKERMREVLKALTTEERRLFSEVLRIESAHLSQKNPYLGPEVTKLVRQIIQ
jgi:hypothetical protein